MLFKALVAKLVLKNTVAEWPAQGIEICVAEKQRISCRGMLSLVGDIGCEVIHLTSKDAYNWYTV